MARCLFKPETGVVCTPEVSQLWYKLTDVLSEQLEDVAVLASLRKLQNKLSNLFHVLRV